MTGRGHGSAGDLLELVRTGRATTRGALQQVTGLSRATVGQRLDRLFRAGWLREGAGGPVDSPLGGRPSITLEFDDAHAVVLAADLDTRHARACVLSLTGELLAEHGGTLVIEDGPDAVLGELGRWFAELLEKAGHRASEVCGIGLAVPGPVDSETGRVVQPPIMPGWDGYDIRGPPGPRLHRTHRRPAGPGPGRQRRQPHGVRRTAHRPPRLLGVRAGQGVDGHRRGSRRRRLHLPGIDGGAGDIGHIRVPAGAQALCRCGSYGCLAAVASGGAVARRLAETGVPAASGSDVRDLLASGHPGAAAFAREAGRQVGDVLATVVTLLNPGVLMIAGDLAGTSFLTGVRELLYQRALPRSTAHLHVLTSRLGGGPGWWGRGRWSWSICTRRSGSRSGCSRWGCDVRVSVAGPVRMVKSSRLWKRDSRHL